MTVLRGIIILCFIFMINIPNYAQITFKGIALEAGIIHNLTPKIFSENHITFYPELNIQGSLSGKIIDWGISLGYWNDGINERFNNVVDGQTYNNSSFIFGLHAKLYPNLLWNNSNLPLRFNIGFSWHYANSKYIGGGWRIPDNNKLNFYQSILNIDTGLDINIFELNNINIYIQPTLLIPLNKHELFGLDLRYKFVLGVDYKFQKD